MSDLLTREEYGAIAAGLNPPTMSFVDGSFRPAAPARPCQRSIRPPAS